MTKSNSGDKTPVTHFCTPRRSGDQSVPRQLLSYTLNKKLGDSQTRCGLKRFFSEANLPKPSATPDCFNKVHMETPQMKRDSEDLPGLIDIEASNLVVGVRVRPLNYREQNDPAVTNIVTVDGSEVKILCESGTSHSFMYDHCFWSCDTSHPNYASQDVVFSTMVHPLVDKAFQGYNACLFAYGQTGSGKSYSMMGLDVDTGNTFGKEAGIIPRFCYEVFERIASLEDTKVSKPSSSRITVEISYFEIYNEKIHDLLGGFSEMGRRAPLKVREHPIFGPYVVDLSTPAVVSYDDLQGWLTVGNSQRATAATGMNEKSSRSHSIFSVILTQMQDEVVMGEHHENNRRSKINLVDLAGSERLSQTCASGDRLREGVSINKSLLTLGKVIAALSDNINCKKKSFVPYRDSVLTWLLRESLGGNSRTTMLATISPASNHLDETLATLRYACQARTIVNRVHINEDPHDRLVRELRAEVERLKAMREEYEQQKRLPVPRRIVGNDMSSEIRTKELEINRLKEQLKLTEEHLSRTQKSWSERLEDAEKCKSAELKFLRQSGVAVQLNWDNQLPCLVNLNDDPILSGTLLYLLPQGTVQVGRRSQNTEDLQPDIILEGPLVQKRHCTFKNVGGKLSLIPLTDGQTFVNGKMITSPTHLQHGDRVVIGGNYYFRVNNPLDHNADRSIQPVDYQFAHHEIHKIQEDKLRAELEEAKKHALNELEETRKEAERQIGSQRLTYEQQLKQLGTALEQQKDALSEERKKKEELEIQKQVLEAEVESQKARRLCLQSKDESLVISPYRPNFLKDIEDALNESFVVTESILRTSPVVSDSSYINLHEMDVMVQEATQRCKELGINYEFRRQHVVGKSGLDPIVRVRDRDKCLTASWKPSHFLHWLDQLRHHDPEDSLKDLLNVEDEDFWEKEDWVNSEDEEDSHVLISTKEMKCQLNESLHQFSLESSSCNNSEIGTHGTYNIDCSTMDSDHYEDLSSYLMQIEDATYNIRKLCDVNNIDNVKHNLDALDCMVKQLRTSL